MTALPISPKADLIRSLDDMLDDIGSEFGTDKAHDGHDYLRVYGDVLGAFVSAPVTMLEIGVWEGASLRMWDKWLMHPQARIVGVDTDLTRCTVADGGRIYLRRGDAGSSDFLRALVSEFRTIEDDRAGARAGAFDVVIDDGSHQIEQQTVSFGVLWPEMRPGGVYIIEDLHTYFWPQANPPNALDWLVRLAAIATGQGRQRWEGPVADIESVTFRQSLAIIKKRP